MNEQGFASRLAWAGTAAVGVWLSILTARCVMVTMERCGVVQAEGAPVREMVEAVLEEHEAEDRPIVHAFEEALEAEEEEAGARVA